MLSLRLSSLSTLRLLQPKQLLIAVALMLAASASADRGFISLYSNPTIAMADGRSTILIDAELRDANGKLVPDGTRVVFSTDLGYFKEPIVSSQHGTARTTLVASSIAGVAKITASAINYQASTTLEYQFVSDRSLLSSARDYVEIIGPKDLTYAVEQKVLGASTDDKGLAVVRYRDIEIRAADIQLNAANYDVRARKAHIKIGKLDAEFSQLAFKLDMRKGWAVGKYRDKEQIIVPHGNLFAFGSGKERDFYGICSISAAGTAKVSEVVPPESFDFTEISEGSTMVDAKKAIVFPGKQIQFHRAGISVQGQRVMKLPLFEMDMRNSQVFSDQIVSINDNKLAINYPYYVSLKPGQTSLFRLRTGQSYGRSFGSSHGTFLDYEMNWSRGDSMQGNLTFGGLGRSDWGVSAAASLRPDEKTSIDADLQIPAHQSLYGTINASRRFNGFETSVNASASKSLRGPRFFNQQYSFVAEKDPIKLGRLPLQLFFGFTATHQTATFSPFSDNVATPLDTGITQTAYGLRLRGNTTPINIGSRTTFSSSFSVSKLQGQNVLRGLTTLGTAALNHNFNSRTSLSLIYDYFNDGVNSALIGQHQLALRGSYEDGKASFSFFGSKGLDSDLLNYQFDAGYRLNRQFRLLYSYTLQRYLGESYFDYNMVLGYTLGGREFGLTWSQKTHRFGIQLLGATFN